VPDAIVVPPVDNGAASRKKRELINDSAARYSLKREVIVCC